MLSIGSSGKEVGRLQTLLNKKSEVNPNLKIDNNFGTTTQRAVIQYQKENWLSSDGRVGPATWSALEGRDKYIFLYHVELVFQHTSHSCWSAALAMLLGTKACMLPGMATASYYSPGILNDTEKPRPENTQKFADSYGLKLLHAQSWEASALANIMNTNGPLMIDMGWDVNSYVKGKGTSSHFMIIAGIRGDGTNAGTTIRIYDPWPVNKGSKYSLTYGPFMQKIPMGTYQVYYNQRRSHYLITK
jgi:hypothetical protein